MTIRWRLREPARVTVTVRDRDDRRVVGVTRRDAERRATHSFTWDGLGGPPAGRPVRRYVVRVAATSERRPRRADDLAAGACERRLASARAASFPRVPVANALSDLLHGITDAVTDAIGNHGLYAVFLLMLDRRGAARGERGRDGLRGGRRRRAPSRTSR